MVSYLTRRVQRLEDALNDKINGGTPNVLHIIYKATGKDKKDKKYYIKSEDIKVIKPDAEIKEGTDIIYDNLDDFENDYKIYLDKYYARGLNIIILDVIDTSETEKAFWENATED